MSSKHHSSGSVLLVEDHQDIAEMLFSYFEQRGYMLDYAADGEVGMRLATENHYDAVILDLMLPRVDGLEESMPYGEPEISHRVHVYEVT